ncbi:MAG: R3H domain-containing nucleic acid-binding protein [Candidatus Paceibacterota bacterium]|jgi:spoIIIJ-associated protein
MEDKKIENLIKEFFQKMECPVELEASLDGNVFSANIRSDEASLLIGQGGQTLADLQHLLTKIIRNNFEGEIFLSLDVENYKKRKIDYLKEMAQAIADEVAFTKKEKLFPPLSAFDRRIVHMELASRTDIKTESIGEDPERRVVVKPV